jgi:hypothetical protein
MQPKMPMHDTFWRNDQVMVVFRSDISLTSGDVIQNKAQLLEKLNLQFQLQQLNQFLQDKQVPVTLHFLDDSDTPENNHPSPSQQNALRVQDGPQLPSGVYLFGLTSPIQSLYGEISTSVLSFLKFEKSSSQGMGSTASEIEVPESGDDDTRSFVPTIVKALNEGLEELNQGRQVPIALSALDWLYGGTPIGQGCPLTPPSPVKDSCSNWHITLPDLDPQLQSMTGDGVTVFILDAFPERGVISRAAKDAGDDNWLLSKVNATISFDYSLMSGVQEILDMVSTGNAAVGKDVYGRHYPTQISDHGLFIAGIVRDIAPDARIECVRVLNFLCVGDLQILSGALWKIYNRMLSINPDTGKEGDLYGKPVVINLSLVIPTDDEAQQKQINPSAGGFNIIQASLFFALQSLAELGAIIVASAGNEGDLREMPAGEMRPMALYPAAFGSPPYSIDGVIAVGAVDTNGHATSYSCYPGPRGIATYGGEIPHITPPNPPSSNPSFTTLDALRGIYSSVEYPPLSVDPPAQYYVAPNDHAWAYWVGTSFATPIISALTARILEGPVLGSVHDAIISAATGVTQWDNLDPDTTGVASGSTTGSVLWAVQQCVDEDDDEDEEEEEVDIEEVRVLVEE